MIVDVINSQSKDRDANLKRVSGHSTMAVDVRLQSKKGKKYVVVFAHTFLV